MNIASYTEYKTPEQFKEHNRILGEQLAIGLTGATLAERLQKVYNMRGLRPFQAMFACTKCGEDRVSSMTIKFFKFDVEKVICYDCQGRKQQ